LRQKAIILCRVWGKKNDAKHSYYIADTELYTLSLTYKKLLKFVSWRNIPLPKIVVEWMIFLHIIIVLCNRETDCEFCAELLVRKWLLKHLAQWNPRYSTGLQLRNKLNIFKVH
jgi:hypothetical protein